MYYKWPKCPDSNKFIFDTNVLIYMHGFLPNEEKAKLFSPIVDYIVKNRHEVYLDKVVISEFINKYINQSLKKKLSIPEDEPFKFEKTKHRSLQEYKDVLTELNTIITQILSAYNIKNMDNIYEICPEQATKALEQMEFNDYLIVESAKKIGATLLTADNDIIGFPAIDTLTA